MLQDQLRVKIWCFPYIFVLTDLGRVNRYFAVGVGEMPLDCVHGEDEVVTCTIKSGTVTAAPPGSLAPFG